MRESVTVNAANPRDYKPKVLIARTIQALSTGVIYPLFRQSGLAEQGDGRELEEFRNAWLAWLNRTPRAAFLSYLDAYYQFLADFSSGHWCPVADREPPRQAALNALKARWGGDRHPMQPSPPDFH